MRGKTKTNLWTEISPPKYYYYLSVNNKQVKLKTGIFEPLTDLRLILLIRVLQLPGLLRFTPSKYIVLCDFTHDWQGSVDEGRTGLVTSSIKTESAVTHVAMLNIVTSLSVSIDDIRVVTGPVWPSWTDYCQSRRKYTPTQILNPRPPKGSCCNPPEIFFLTTFLGYRKLPNGYM